MKSTTMVLVNELDDVVFFAMFENNICKKAALSVNHSLKFETEKETILSLKNLKSNSFSKEKASARDTTETFDSFLKLGDYIQINPSLISTEKKKVLIKRLMPL